MKFAKQQSKYNLLPIVTEVTFPRNIESLKTRDSEFRQKRQQLLQAQQEKEARHRELDTQMRTASNQLQKLKGDKAALVKAGPEGKLGLYGNRMEEVLHAIRSDKGFKNRVLGPLGMYVKLDPQFKAFGRAVENGLGSKALRSFLVTCIEDKNRLAQIFKNFGLLESSNIVVEQDCPKYNVQRPPLEGAVTILDSLIIDEPSVFNAIVDMSGVDSVLLVKNNDDCMERFVERVNGRRQFKHPSISKAVRFNLPWCTLFYASFR